jgi:glycosyltransferase involved in cell wall biosynthesis
MISVIILTFNSENIISKTLETALQISDDIHIVDSFSSDATLEIAKEYNVNIVQHEFENYGKQRNWAISNLHLQYDWELHLDADERLSDELINQIKALDLNAENDVNGYYIPRLVYFMGYPIKHGGMFPIWHMRLFRHGKGRCEDRQYDQHFYVDGKTSKLKGAMIDDNNQSLTEWTSRHNRWANAEVREILGADASGRIQANLRGSPVQQKRFLRNFYNNFPLFVRPFLLFIYRYVFRLGFLDGKAGLVFFVLQTFWFKFLIDAKLFEKKLSLEKPKH